jgi:hypothetical protein
MSIVMDEDVKRWTARRKSALVLEIIQGKTIVAEASRHYNLTSSEVEEWVEQCKAGWKMLCGPKLKTSVSNMSSS